LRIIQIYRLPEFYTRYDLTIAETHNFVANGFVVHNSSAHITWSGGFLSFFSGGAKSEQFIELFNQDELRSAFEKFGEGDVKIYGEVYGGKMQKMSATYGKELKFVAFEVKVGESWLVVPAAESVAWAAGLEFVHYKQIPATLEAIDAERDAESWQAVRNKMGPGHIREGVVLRPLMELRKNNGERIIAKHKRAEFAEHLHQPKVVDPAQLQVLMAAEAIADQWCVPMRLEHVLQTIEATGMEHTSMVIKAMLADIQRESVGEIVWSKAAEQAIGKRAAQLWKKRVCNIANG